MAIAQWQMQWKGMFAASLAVCLLAGCSSSKHPPVEETSGVPMTQLQLGMDDLKQGNLPAAKTNLQQAVDASPLDYRNQLGMALYEQKVGNKDAAQSRYQQAFKLAPQNGTVINNYGAFLCSLGQYVSSQQQFSTAASLPDSGPVADSLESAGYCFLKANQNDEAKMLLSQALKRDPDKGATLITEANRQYKEGNRADAQLLLDVYQHVLPASADSLMLQIRFAALADNPDSVQRYGKQLARNFPQSQQYQQFLANEY